MSSLVLTDIDPRDWVDDRPDDGVFRVRRAAMTSEDILELERDRVFSRHWLYVGHESELASTGDYRSRVVGCRPVVFVRPRTGGPVCLLDRCSSCGGRLSADSWGTASAFQCGQNHRFSLDGMPMPDIDGPSPVRRVPRFESYRGFWFLNHDADADDLEHYLAGVTEYIDLVVDQSEVGMRVLPGSQEFGFHANWKLYVENSFDIYHALPVHQTYFQYLATRGGGVKFHGRRAGTARRLGPGHAVAELEASYARPVARWDPTFGEDAKEEIEAIRARLVERHGEERAFRMADTIRLTLTFPNFILDDIPAITIRSINPVRADYTVVQSWALAPVEESDRLLKRRLESYLAFIGPGGFATPDDVEAVESCQAGFAASEVEWSDISRGAHRSPNLADDEVQMQTFWRGWAAAMGTT